MKRLKSMSYLYVRTHTHSQTQMRSLVVGVFYLAHTDKPIFAHGTHMFTFKFLNRFLAKVGKVVIGE